MGSKKIPLKKLMNYSIASGAIHYMVNLCPKVWDAPKKIRI